MCPVLQFRIRLSNAENAVFTPAQIETKSRTDDSEPAQGPDQRPDRIAPQVPQVREDDAWNEDQT